MADDTITGEPIPLAKGHTGKTTEPAEAPLVDEVLDAMEIADTIDNGDDVEISEQLSAMQTEVYRIRESVMLIGDGARTIVQTKVRTVTQDLEERIRINPIPSVLIAAFAGYCLGVIRRR
jgi:hypothetical protein